MKANSIRFVPLLFALLLQPLAAQFGQNIVQYDDYDWRFIQTPYFDIYYYGEDYQLAEYASEVADEAYIQISDRLNWKLMKRVSIMVYRSHSDFQQTNVTFSYMYEGIGGVTELFKNRVVIPFEGDFDAFRNVIRHELVHAVLNDMIYGGNIQSAVSGRIRYSIPGWMNEGLAEYLASGWDTESEMYMRDLALGGEIPEIPQLTGYYAYRGGQSVWRFITSKWGEEAIAEIFAQVKIKASIERGIKAAIGLDLEQLSEEWREYIKKEYWPDIVARERIEDVAYPVTDHEKLGNIYNIAPAVSPDGSRLAILRNHRGQMEIVLISATDGKYLKRLIRGGSTHTFEELHITKPGITWAPDGKRIAFAAKAGGEDVIWVVDVAKGKRQRYPTGLEGVFMASWHPTENKIAFSGNDGYAGDIHILDLDNGEVVNITNDVFSNQNPVWSPDGSYLVFASERGDHSPFRYDEAGVQYPIQRRYDPQLGVPLSSLAPGVNLEEIDFGGRDIYRIDPDGSNLQRLTFDPAREDYPVFASSAPYLFYTSDRSGINNVYMLNMETGEERAVTNIHTGIADLNMTSDDSRLFFTGFANSGYDIYRINNPVELWEQPQEIPLTAFALGDTIDTEITLLNDDREPKTGSGIANYQNYIFGFHTQEEREPDSTALVGLPETAIRDSGGRHRVYEYKTRYTLDLVQTYAAYNTMYSFQGMTQFMFSDMLGNHRISLATEMQISLENSDYFFTYHYLTRRPNFYFTGYHTAFLYSAYNSPYLRRLRNYGLDVTASVPIDRFRRFDLGITASRVEDARFFQQPDLNYYLVGTTRMTTVIPRAGLVWDNAEWSYLHPVNGWRASVFVSASPPVGNDGIQFQSVSFDTRRYFRLMGGTSIAARLSGGASYGPDAQLYLMGGLSWLFSSETERYNPEQEIVPDDAADALKIIYFSQYATPLRGTQLMEIVGEKALLLNLEYRFPFLIYYFPALRSLGQLGGVLFTDVGQTWGIDPVTKKYKQQAILTYGWGPRFILLGIPFQLDYAWQYDPPAGDKKRNWYLTIGLDF